LLRNAGSLKLLCMKTDANSLENLTATELARLLAARELSSREATAYFLDRIERLDRHTQAFVHVDPQRALDDAAAVDARRVAGETLSPLAGVPVAVKDILCARDIPTTCASAMLRNFRPPYNATVIERLSAAGLVAIGRTNMDEFAMGGSTENSIFGATRNPWDAARTAGGSSGGSAAALAGGLAPIAIGTDTGGSVRQPAAFCGVWGLKPTYGRISRFGLIAFASSLDQVGPFARSAEDMAAVLQVLAGHDPRDSTSLPAPVENFSAALEQPIRGLRVGVVREQLDSEGLAPEVRTAVQAAAAELESSGAILVDVQLPHAKYSVPTYYLIAPCEASSNLARYDAAHYGYRSTLPAGEATLEAMYRQSRSEGFGTEVKRRIMLGTFALSAGYYDAYYRKALQVRRLIADDYKRAFEQVDVLLGPTTPTAAFGLGEKLNDPVQMYLVDLYTVGANLAGIPAVSVPAAVAAGGLPVGVQLQGPALSEARLLTFASQLEKAGFTSSRIAELI
jgi:aspartyl-tRNA(Asn)/glutamyl-tRNA(Gln) amidotransferase subunit A